jgi:predicted CopG family antitoxin
MIQKDRQFVTIAVKLDTYRELSQIKSKYRLKSFDDVIKLLLDGSRGRL